MNVRPQVRDYIKVSFRENVVIWLMYVFAIPIAKIGIYFKISPNGLTSISSVLAAISGLTLLADGFKFLFAPLFILSIVFDFADGLVARVTGNIGRTSFRYDHTSDLFKISYVCGCMAIYFDSKAAWIVIFGSTALFLTSTILNHDLDYARRNSKMSETRYDIRPARQNALITNLFTILFTYNSHSLLLICYATFNKEAVLYVFGYLLLNELIIVFS